MDKITNNNDKYTRFNWHMNTMHNINKSRVSLLKRLKCDSPDIAQG